MDNVIVVMRVEQLEYEKRTVVGVGVGADAAKIALADYILEHGGGYGESYELIPMKLHGFEELKREIILANR